MAKTKCRLGELNRKRRDFFAQSGFEKPRTVLLDVRQNFRQDKPLQKFISHDPLIMPDDQPLRRLEDCLLWKSLIGESSALEMINYAIVEL